MNKTERLEAYRSLTNAIEILIYIFSTFEIHMNMMMSSFSILDNVCNISGTERPLPPPPSDEEWYHGRLDRYSAEQRLKNNHKRLGSYLGELECMKLMF